MRVLCSGDLHIGRRPSRLPVDSHDFSCASAWGAIVDYAVNQAVDLVALSGDIVDQANRYYEALGPLEKGLRRLQAAGIPVVAVTGNHDFDVLPELARTLPPGCLQLIGVGGRWERVTIERGDRKLHVDGWSFPTQHVRESPLASYELPLATDAPTLGILHGDLDVSGSYYAPLALAELHAREVTMWLLGHVHAGRLHESSGRVPVLYPGSPQPMDPGEEGVHGAWLIDLEPGRPVRAELIPLATVRYGTLDIDVGDVADLPAARSLFADRVREAAREMVLGTPLRQLSLRLRLVGRSSLHRELERQAELMAADLTLDVEGASVQVERVSVEVRPARDLEALSLGSDALSLVARLLRDIEQGQQHERHAELFRALDQVPTTLQAAKPYKQLDPVSHEENRKTLDEALARQASLLLDEMLAQKESVA